MPNELRTCPRRVEDGRAGANSPFVGSGPDLDSWRADAAGPSCSYCGSLHPDRFMELVRDGWTVGPTDKSYKAYLERMPTKAEVAQAKANWAESNPVARAVREIGERDGKTAEQIAIDLDEQWAKDPHVLTGGHTKFYFQHLSAEQRADFIELHNSGAMVIGYPGHFYQPPYFTRPEPAA